MPNELSLSAKLQIEVDGAISAMKRVGQAFSGLDKSVTKAHEGIKSLQSGFSGVGYAAAAAKLGVAASVKKLADFEGQMGAVKAVLGNEAKASFEGLEKEALRLGATTSFTAKDAAAAMENLARAGFSATEIMQATGPVLDAAAAEGMDLATAAEIVSANMKAFGKNASDAGHIADVLAKVSAITATSIVELQEGLKYAAPVARTANVSLEQTASILGVLSDVGLKSTLAGTAFKNAIIKVAESAKDGKVEVGDYYAKIEYGSDGMMNAQNTFLNMVKAIAQIQDPLKRVQVGMDLLGIRGQGVATALEALKPETAEKLFDKLNTGADGASKSMAQMRLDNLAGDFVRLSSAMDGAVIAFGKMFRPEVVKITKSLTVFLSDAFAAFQLFSKEGSLGASQVQWELGKLNQTAVQVVTGLREGWTSVKSIFGGFVGVIGRVVNGFRAMLSPISAAFGEDGGPMSVQSLVKTTMQVMALAVGFNLVGGAVGKMGEIAKGSFQIMSGILGGMKTGLGGLITLLSKRFPAMGKLAGPLKSLGGAASTLDKMTAQPVRVVNWDEAGGGIGGGGGNKPLSGQLPLPGFGDDGTTPPIKPPTGLGGQWKAAQGIVGKAGMIAKVGGAVLAAGAVGFEIGTFIDKSFQLSDKISSALNSGKKAEAAARAKAFGESTAEQTMRQQASQLVDFARRGVTVETAPGGERKAVDAALVRERLMKFALSKNTGLTTEQAKTMVKSIMAEMGPQLAEAVKGVKIDATLNVDGRPVAKGVASSEQERSSRLGKAQPGARRQAAQR